MKNFSDFNIEIDRFTGKKIEISEVTGNPIEVLDFKIEPSKFTDKGNGKRLTLQIRYDDRERVVFTSSIILQEQCAKVREKGSFPFRAIIKELKPRGFIFTGVGDE